MRAICLAALALLTALPAAAQDPEREVLPEQRQRLAFIAPSGLAPLGSGKMVFSAFHVTTGQELWVTDGSNAGTTLLKDIRPGFRGSFPAGQVAFKGHVYTTATDGASGLELWRTDGTAAGTTQVIDLRPGEEGAMPNELTVFRDALYFVADDGQTGFQVWKTTGDAKGTTRVSAVDAGPRALTRQLTVAGPRLFFTATTRTQGHELRFFLRRDLVTRTRQRDLQDLGDNARRLAEHDDVVGQVDALVDVVGDDQDGDAQLRLDVQQQVLELCPGLRVDGGEGLVHHQQPWVAGERSGDRDPLLHPARHLPGVQVCLVPEADRVEALLHARGPLGLGQLAEREGDVLLHGHPGEEGSRVVLEHQGEAVRYGVDDPAVEENLARRCIVQPADDPQQCGLAGTRRADDDGDLACGNGGGDVADRRRRAVGLGELAELELGGCCGFSHGEQ